MMQELPQRGGAASAAGGSYLKRTGPAIEKEALLGSVLKFGLPMENTNVTSNFSNAATKTLKDVNRRVDNIRQQLRFYQDTLNALFKLLVTSEAAYFNLSLIFC